MVSLNAAKLLKFDTEIGSIETGKKADIVVFDNEKSFASVSYVFVDGICKYSADYMHGVKPLQAEKKAEWDVLNSGL